MSVRQGFKEIDPGLFVNLAPPPITPAGMEFRSGLLPNYFALHCLAICIKDQARKEIPELTYINSAERGAKRLFMGLASWFKNPSDLNSLSPDGQEASAWLRSLELEMLKAPTKRFLELKDEAAQAEVGLMDGEFRAFASLRETTELGLDAAGAEFLRIEGEARGMSIGSVALLWAARDAEIRHLDFAEAQL